MSTDFLCPCTTCDDFFPIELSLLQCAAAEAADIKAGGVSEWSSCRYLELLPSPAGKRQAKEAVSGDCTASDIKGSSDATLRGQLLLNECAISTTETSNTCQENVKRFSFPSTFHPPSGREDTGLSLALAHFLLGPLATHPQPLQPCLATDNSPPGTATSAELCDARGASYSVPRLEDIFEGLPTPEPSPGGEAGEGASSAGADCVSAGPGCAASLLEPLAAEIRTAIAVGNGMETCMPGFPRATEEEDLCALSPQDISGFPEIIDMMSLSSLGDLLLTSSDQEHQTALSAEQPVTASPVQLSPSVEEWLPNLADYLTFDSVADSFDLDVQSTGLHPSSRDFLLKTQASQKGSAASSQQHFKPYKNNGPLEKNFQCSFCKRRYARKGFLQRHIMRTHEKA